MDKPSFTSPDLDAFCLLDGLGLTAVGQLVTASHGLLECRAEDSDNFCHSCDAEGVPRGTVLRRLAHLPMGWRPTILRVRVRRYRCAHCRRVWRQDTSRAAAPRAKWLFPIEGVDVGVEGRVVSLPG